MKAKDLIHELQKFDPENDVAEEWEFDLDTVFITGKQDCE